MVHRGTGTMDQSNVTIFFRTYEEPRVLDQGGSGLRPNLATWRHVDRGCRKRSPIRRGNKLALWPVTRIPGPVLVAV